MRFHIGREMLKIQGIDWEDWPQIDSYSEAELGDLAGNAFASTCIMAAVIGAFSTVTVGAPPDEQRDLDNVFKAVKTVFDFDSTQAVEGEGTGVKED